MKKKSRKSNKNVTHSRKGSQFFSGLRTFFRSFAFPAILSLLVSVACYFQNNIPYPFGVKLDWLTYSDNAWRLLFDWDEDRSDVLFVNVGYDKDIVDFCINECDTGRVDITDRYKLLEFLRLAEESNTYKCIFLDIRFEKGYDTPVDSQLFSQILHMRDVYFSTHSFIELASDSLSPKALINDYFVTFKNTGFSRYPMIQTGKKSAPLVIDSIVNHSEMNQWGPFYTYNGHLCQNSPFLAIKDKVSLKRKDEVVNYVDMGAYYLNFARDMFATDAMDKIVILGDFINDQHDTYAGEQPGSYLVYLAYKTLREGQHIVRWTLSVVLFVLYLLLFYAILNGISFASWLSKYVTNDGLLQFFISMFTYSLVLSVFSSIVYLLFGTINNIFVPALIISLLEHFVQYYKRS